MVATRKAGRIHQFPALGLGLIAWLAASGVQGVAATERLVCTHQELASAISASKPGDQIVLCDTKWVNAHIKLDVAGTPSAPITLRAETPGKVLMTGHSTLELAGSHAVVTGLVFTGTYTGTAARIVAFRIGDRPCNNCRLTNSAFIDYNPADPTLRNIWVSIYGRNNRVDHNYFSGKANSGVLLQVMRTSNQADRARIDHNFFSRPLITQSNGGETVQIGTSGEFAASNSLTAVEANFFYQASGELEIISNKASANTIRRNTFLGSRGAVTIRYGDRVIVEGNYFLGGGEELTGGVRIYGESHRIINNYFEGLNPGRSKQRGAIYFGTGDSEIDPALGFYFYPAVRNVLVAHNTIVDSVNSLYFLGGDSTGGVVPENVVIRNNIVSHASEALLVETVKPNNVTYERNLFHGPKPAVVGVDNLVAEPALIRNTDAVLRLSKTSVAVGAAIPTVEVKRDIDGIQRDGAPDIGADEYRFERDYWRPIGLCDVGPSTFKPGLMSNCSSRRPLPPFEISATS